MCGLYGVVVYGKGHREMDSLVRSLGRASTVRGTDATGIAYVHEGKLEIEKASKSAFDFKVDTPKGTKAIIGHTRRTTQGSFKKNYNNHPFRGKAGQDMFALAHNGVLYNESYLRKEHNIPKPQIETDSYIAVQMVESRGKLSPEALRFMAERVDGSFTFTILDERNNLWLVKGNNPLVIAHLPSLGMYVYASTESILMDALLQWSPSSNLIMQTLRTYKPEVGIIDPEEGDILCISAETGEITEHNFILGNHVPRRPVVTKGGSWRGGSEVMWENAWEIPQATSTKLPDGSIATKGGSWVNRVKDAVSNIEESDADNEYFEQLAVMAERDFGVPEDVMFSLLELFSITEIETALMDGSIFDLVDEFDEYMNEGLEHYPFV